MEKVVNYGKDTADINPNEDLLKILIITYNFQIII